MKKGEILINVNDIIGKRLGKLEVNRYLGFNYTLTKGGLRVRHFYLCKCECGAFLVSQRGPLKNDLFHSCGCVRHKAKQEVQYGNKDAQ